MVKPNKKQRAWKVLTFLLLVFCFFSMSGTTNASASWLTSITNTESTLDSARQHMLDIAYLYAHHRWQATATNIIHPDGIHTDADAYSYEQNDDPQQRYLLEQDHVTRKYINGGTLLRDAMFPLVDTPAWILTEEGVYNVGVPYAWGLSSGVVATTYDQQIDPDIEPVFIPLNINRSFDEDIANGYFAGNQPFDLNQGGNWWAAGVDCIGLINNVWQMGARFPMDITKNEYAMPIRFKDLKPGDILMDETVHVMLFGGFVNYDPNSGQNPEIGTKFWVYEAAGDPYWKVVGNTPPASPYVVSDIKYVASDDPNYNDKVGTFKGTQPLTDIVQITGLEDDYHVPYNFVPRTYYPTIPLNVVLVIDQSGSMTGEKMEQTKEAAQTFVDMMRDGDRLAVVGFDSEAHQVFHPSANVLITLDESLKATAKQLIRDNIFAGGGMSIEAGLQQGLTDIVSTTSPRDEGLCFL